MKIIKTLIALILIALAAYAGFVYGQLALQKNFLEVQIPINQDVAFNIDQEINFPLNTTIKIPINTTIFIKKTIPLKTSIFIDTIVRTPVNISGSLVYVNVPIKTTVPISTFIEINEPIEISEDVPFLINQDFIIPIKKDITLPIDTVIKTRVPLPWSKEL